MEPKLEERLRDIAIATKNTKQMQTNATFSPKNVLNVVGELSQVNFSMSKENATVPKWHMSIQAVPRWHSESIFHKTYK